MRWWQANNSSAPSSTNHNDRGLCAQAARSPTPRLAEPNPGRFACSATAVKRTARALVTIGVEFGSPDDWRGVADAVPRPPSAGCWGTEVVAVLNAVRPPERANARKLSRSWLPRSRPDSPARARRTPWPVPGLAARRVRNLWSALRKMAVPGCPHWGSIGSAIRRSRSWLLGRCRASRTRPDRGGPRTAPPPRVPPP
jgi:hypothetical protein